MTFDIGLHEVCVLVGGQAGARTSKPNFLGWIVYQILLHMVLRCAHFARARAPLLVQKTHINPFFFVRNLGIIGQNILLVWARQIELNLKGVQVFSFADHSSMT